MFNFPSTRTIDTLKEIIREQKQKIERLEDQVNILSLKVSQLERDVERYRNSTMDDWK